MGRSAVGRCRERRGRFNSHDNPIALSRPVNTNPSGRNRQNVPATGLSGLRNSGDPRPVLTLRRRTTTRGRTRDLVVPQQLLEQLIGQRLGRAEVAIATNAENSHRHGRSQNCRERGGGAATAVVGVTDSRLTAPDRKCSRPRSWLVADTCDDGAVVRDMRALERGSPLLLAAPVERAIIVLQPISWVRPSGDQMSPILWLGLCVAALPFFLWAAWRLLLAAISSRCPRCGSKFYSVPVCGDRRYERWHCRACNRDWDERYDDWDPRDARWARNGIRNHFTGGGGTSAP